MADTQQQQQQQQQTISAPFPAPPPFYKHHTLHNKRRLRQLQRGDAVSNGSATDERHSNSNADIENNSTTSPSGVNVLDLPHELRYLLPPAPPKEDTYTSFGTSIDLHAPSLTLADAGIEDLTPTAEPGSRPDLDPRAHLTSLVRSTLTTYLSLLGLLATHPTHVATQQRTQDLEILMFNLHDCVNRYRPHQAREALVRVLEGRVGKLKGEVDSIREGREKVKSILAELRETGIRGVEVEGVEGREEVDAGHAGRGDGKSERQRRAWNALEGLTFRSKAPEGEIRVGTFAELPGENLIGGLGGEVEMDASG